MDEEEVFYDTVEDDGNIVQQQGDRCESVYELHRAAFNDEREHLRELLQRMPQEQYTQLDLHGNTALHVAAMRGNTAAVELLVAAGFPAKARSSRGWTAFDEACAAQAMPAARVLQQRMLYDSKMDMKQKRAQLLDSMRQMPDYSLQLKWQLGSAVPGLGMLLRKYAPHDTYTIWKVGDKLRVDGSLLGVDTKSLVPEWKRGHFSLIVDGSPEGLAAAAAAAEEAMAAARKAAKQKSQRRQQHWQSSSQQQKDEQQQQQAEAEAGGSSSRGVSPAPAPVTPSGCQQMDATSSSVNGSGGVDRQQDSTSTAGDQQQQQPQQEFLDAEPAPSVPRGPRLLFLNHSKGSWVDLSADKKALKAEAEQEEEQELNSELLMAMQEDMEKLRLKPRGFKFAPVKGWLGGDQTEKVEGWKCTIYEAAGKLLAVSTSKARLQLSDTATFEDYLIAEYAADEVSEMMLDPLTPSGIEAMSSSKKERSTRSTSSAHSSSKDMMGVDSDADGTVWWESGGTDAAGSSKGSSSSSSRKWGKSKSTGSKGAKADGAGAEASSSGRVLRARCWMAQDFPMSLQQLLPLLDVIGNANKHMAKVGKFLEKYSQMEMFPVKLQVPLLLTVHALVSFKAFHLLQPGSGDPALAPDFFTVPDSYTRRRLQDVMEKAGKNAFGGAFFEEDDEEWGAESGGTGWFWGGDEGAEYMQGGDADGDRSTHSSDGGAGQNSILGSGDRGYRIGSGL